MWSQSRAKHGQGHDKVIMTFISGLASDWNMWSQLNIKHVQGQVKDIRLLSTGLPHMHT